MSERGSFVTQYMYCHACMMSAETVLCVELGAALSAQRLQWTYNDELLPIIAGSVRGSYRDEEQHIFELEVMPALSRLVCHNVSVAVLAENGHHAIYVASPAYKHDTRILPAIGIRMSAFGMPVPTC